MHVVVEEEEEEEQREKKKRIERNQFEKLHSHDNLLKLCHRWEHLPFFFNSYRANS